MPGSGLDPGECCWAEMASPAWPQWASQVPPMGPSAVSHPEVEVAWSSRGEARRSGLGMCIRREKEKAFSFSVKMSSLLWLQEGDRCLRRQTERRKAGHSGHRGRAMRKGGAWGHRPWLEPWAHHSPGVCLRMSHVTSLSLGPLVVLGNHKSRP